MSQPGLGRGMLPRVRDVDYTKWPTYRDRLIEEFRAIWYARLDSIAHNHPRPRWSLGSLSGVASHVASRRRRELHGSSLPPEGVVLSFVRMTVSHLFFPEDLRRLRAGLRKLCARPDRRFVPSRSIDEFASTVARDDRPPGEKLQLTAAGRFQLPRGCDPAGAVDSFEVSAVKYGGLVSLEIDLHATQRWRRALNRILHAPEEEDVYVIWRPRRRSPMSFGVGSTAAWIARSRRLTDHVNLLNRAIARALVTCLGSQWGRIGPLPSVETWELQGPGPSSERLGTDHFWESFGVDPVDRFGYQSERGVSLHDRWWGSHHERHAVIALVDAAVLIPKEKIAGFANRQLELEYTSMRALAGLPTALAVRHYLDLAHVALVRARAASGLEVGSSTTASPRWRPRRHRRATEQLYRLSFSLTRFRAMWRMSPFLREDVGDLDRFKATGREKWHLGRLLRKAIRSRLDEEQREISASAGALSDLTNLSIQRQTLALTVFSLLIGVLGLWALLPDSWREAIGALLGRLVGR